VDEVIRGGEYGEVGDEDHVREHAVDDAECALSHGVVQIQSCLQW
jgi:hypothetical protein